MRTVNLNKSKLTFNIFFLGKFRFKAQNVLLTYTNCRMEKEDLIDLLRGKMGNHHFKSWIVGKELHASGVPHLHAMLTFVKNPDFKNSRCFDINGIHPNIRQVGKSVQDRFNVAEYCMKVAPLLGSKVPRVFF